MKTKQTILTGTTIIALLFIAFLAGSCATSGDASSDTTPARAAVADARLASGTYTFYPRLRASQGGVDVNAYLDRVEVKGDTVIFFLVNEAISNGGVPAGEWRHSWRVNASQFILQDLDRPSRTWERANFGDDEAGSGGMFFAYQGVNARRLKLTDRESDPNVVFDEIILGEPDPVLQLPSLKNGTYTFYPRIRAIQSGADVNAYIDRIVVRGEYMNIFLTNESIGKGGSPAGEFRHSWRVNGDRFFIQDLDRPARTWIRVNYGDDEITGGMFLTYQGVNATRFKLTDRDSHPNIVFEEIIMGEPD
jgi:hypothetical protein